MGMFKDIWNRSKDGARKEQRSFIRFAIMVTAVTAVFLLVKKNNVVRWIQAECTINSQEKQIARFKEDIAALDEQIDLLSNDRDSLEKFAREQYHFAEKGDDIYIVRK